MNKRWLVILQSKLAFDMNQLRSWRKTAMQQITALGIPRRANHRFGFYLRHSEETYGFVELKASQRHAI
jgi:hypothetical protein